MKKQGVCYFGSIISAAIAIFCCLTVSHASTYQDVADNDWHAEAIEYVKDIGLMSGTGNGYFQPDQILTRAQIVTILYSLAGSPDTEYNGQFQDVPADAWYSRPISWAYEKGIVYGTSETTFSPSSKITREQLAVIIDQYLKAEGIKLEDAENAQWRMKDCWSVSYYAEDGVVMVCETGVMNPDQQYNFNPQSGVTRADAAVVFMRLSKALSGERLTGMLIPNTKINFSTYSQKEKDASALAVAQHIASVIPSDRDDAERIAMAAHIISHYSKFCEYTMSGKDYRTAYGVFVKGEYSCAGSTRALGLVLTCMGYEWRHINENQYSHQWCELTINGRTLTADGQTGEVNYIDGDTTELVSHLFVGFIDPWPYTLQ